MKTKIILAGGSGFLGNVLADHFAAKGIEAVILTRSPKPRAGLIREVGWDGATIGGWLKELEGTLALINLAGVSVNCRYHARNRKLLLDSRLDSTRVLGEAIARCTNPPPVWLNSSTATIYKHTFGPAWDEAGEIGGCAEAKDIFSVHIATEWERVFNVARTPPYAQSCPALGDGAGPRQEQRAPEPAPTRAARSWGQPGEQRTPIRLVDSQGGFLPRRGMDY